MAVVFLSLLFFQLLLSSPQGANSQPTSDVYFTAAPYEKTINQNHLQGEVLFRVQCAHVNRTGVKFVYSLLGADHFSINSSTGDIILESNALDIAEESPWSPIVLCNDQLSSGNNRHSVPTSTEADIRFELQNRFRPKFDPYLLRSAPLSFSFREDHIFPYDVVVLNATDRDLGVCGEIKMSIDELHTPFRMRQSDNVLELISELDFETDSNYTLTVRASNIESSCVQYSSSSSNITVHISVENINDERPIFEEHQQVFQFNETTMPVNFVQLVCHDPDTPPSGIVYTEEYPLNENPFRINHQTGEVSADDIIDYEVADSFQLRFACIDATKQELMDETTLTIQVLPVNEFVPMVEKGSFFTRISELSPPGTLIGSTSQDSGASVVYRVTDPDQGLDHGDVRYRFSRNNRNLDFLNEHLNLDDETGDLMISSAFDFDSCNQSANDNTGLRIIPVRVTVCDRFSSLTEADMCPTFLINIWVAPADCTPNFLKNQTLVNVSEITPIGSRLHALPCNVRGQTTSERTIDILSLDPVVQDTFVLEDDTIVLKENLDFETTQNYSFFLECFDDTTSDFASVYIQVLPENDNEPYFEKNLFVFNVNRSVVSESDVYSLGSVQAFDDDLDFGSELEYSLSPNLDMNMNNDVMEYFSIDAIFGTINMRGNLKQINESVIVFDVNASDGNFSSKSSVLVILDSQAECSLADLFIVIAILSLLVVVMLLVIVVFGFCFKIRQSKKRTESRLNNTSVMYELPSGYETLQPNRNAPTQCAKFNGTNGTTRGHDNPSKLLESSLDFPEKPNNELDYHYVTPNSYQGGQSTTFGHNNNRPQNYLAPSTTNNNGTTAPLSETDEYLDMRPTFKPMQAGGIPPVAHPPTELPAPPVDVKKEEESFQLSPRRRHSVDNIYEHLQ